MNITKHVNLDAVEGSTVSRTIRLGDVMLLEPRRSAGKAITGNVSRITKKQFRVVGSDGKEHGPFKLEGWNQRKELLEDGSVASWESTEPATQYSWDRFEEVSYKTGDEFDACTFNHQMVADGLNARTIRAVSEAEEKKAAEAKRQQEYDERTARELAEVKAALGCGNGENLFIIGGPCQKSTMPDGSRVYTIDIPAHPAYAERKAGWERVIVRCKDAKYYDFEAHEHKQGVEAAYTYIHGGSCSFASCSTTNYSSDEEAIWDALRRQYHSSW